MIHNHFHIYYKHKAINTFYSWFMGVGIVLTMLMVKKQNNFG